MAQGLAAIAEYKKKQEEALKAAEGKDKPATTGLKAAAPKKEEPAAKPAPPAEPYVPQKPKTPEEKAKLAEEMKAEMEFRARKAAGRK